MARNQSIECPLQSTKEGLYGSGTGRNNEVVLWYAGSSHVDRIHVSWQCALGHHVLVWNALFSLTLMLSIEAPLK